MNSTATKVRTENPNLGSFSIGDAPKGRLPWWRGKVGVFRRIYTSPCKCGSPNCPRYQSSAVSYWASDGKKIYGPYNQVMYADQVLSHVLRMRKIHNRKIMNRICIILLLALISFVAIALLSIGRV